MHVTRFTTFGTLTLALAVAGCNRQPAETERTDAPTEASRTAELQRERDAEVARLNERVAGIERDYAQENQQVTSGARTPTAGLREELKEDVANVKKAVSDLATTTPENWWERHEQAVSRTAEDIEADVRRLAGKVVAVEPRGTTGEQPSAAPFTSRRDAFVDNLRARVEAFERALDGVKASGARETELEDTRARVRKLAEDLDRLRSAEADDWWDVSKARVAEYLDRVERSVARLDDNKPEDATK